MDLACAGCCSPSQSCADHVCVLPFLCPDVSPGTLVSGSAYESGTSEGLGGGQEGWLSSRSFPQTVQALTLPTCISTGKGGVCVCVQNSGIQLGLEGLKCLEKINLFACSGGNWNACTMTLAHCNTES